MRSFLAVVVTGVLAASGVALAHDNDAHAHEHDCCCRHGEHAHAHHQSSKATEDKEGDKVAGQAAQKAPKPVEEKTPTAAPK